MVSIFRNLWRNIPTLLLAFSMAIITWIFAVSSADPIEEHIYPFTVPVEIRNQNPHFIITSDIPSQVQLSLSAPISIWDRLNNEKDIISAYIDLNDLDEGEYTKKIEAKIDIQPVDIVSITPQSIELTLEKVSSQSFSIRLNRHGEPAIGYQADVPKLSQTTAVVSGPEKIIKQVEGIIAVLDLDGTNTDINRTITLQAIDANGAPINNVNISPDQIIINQKINQLGGYRNLAVKVVVKGQIGAGYRLTNISAFPAAVTVFSTDPDTVNDLPGYVETEAIDVNNIKDDLDVQVPLSLPTGVSVVGENNVQVQVGIAAIEGSMTWNNMAVTITGLAEGLKATASPSSVDVIVSGPLPILDSLKEDDITVYVDMTDKKIGTHQKVPRVDLAVADLRITSILPESIEVTIEQDNNPQQKTENNGIIKSTPQAVSTIDDINIIPQSTESYPSDQVDSTSTLSPESEAMTAPN